MPTQAPLTTAAKQKLRTVKATRRVLEEALGSFALADSYRKIVMPTYNGGESPLERMQSMIALDLANSEGFEKMTEAELDAVLSGWEGHLQAAKAATEA